MSKPKTNTRSPAEAALRRLAAAERAVRTHKGATAGETYDRKVAEWRSSYTAAVRLGGSMIRENENAGDAG